MKKENVYLIRGAGGEYALGTKICTSSSGAKNSMNSYVDGIIDHTIRVQFPGYSNPMSDMAMVWRWQGGRKRFNSWITLEHYLMNSTNANYVKITEQDYDEFVKLVTDICNYWTVEEVVQNDHYNH